MKLLCSIVVFALCCLSTTNAQTVITLEKAFEIANQSSPSLRQSQLSMHSSKELLNAQQASLKSQFSLNVTPISYSHNRLYDDYATEWYTKKQFNPSAQFSVIQPVKFTNGTLSLSNTLSYLNSYSESDDETDKYFSNGLTLSLDQPIFTYNETKMDLRKLELDYENSALDFALQKLTIEKNVTQSFYTVYQNQMSLQIAEEEYQNQKKSYEIIKNKVEAGLAAREELFQAELNLASSKSEFQNQEVEVENAKDEFKQLIGLSLYEEITILADVSIDTVNVDMEKAISNALTNRMELRQREIDIQNAQFDLIVAKATNEFKGNISFSVGLSGENKEIPNVYSSPTDNEDIALSLEIPIWDWGQRKSVIKASELSLQAEEISFEEEKNDIILNIRQSYRSLKNLLNQIDIARQNVKNAELTYDINLERYENGDLTSMDLDEYQTQLSEEKMNLTNAIIEYKIELLNLKIQSLWDFVEDKPVMPIEFNMEESKKK